MLGHAPQRVHPPPEGGPTRLRYDSAVLLTIGIPTYDRADDVMTTVREILSHPDSDLVDVVVIDDGGSDGTRARLVEDAEIARRVRVLENDVNLGYARTFARLFRECRTEYLMMTADDDRVLMPNLRGLLDHLDAQRPAFVCPQFLRGSRVSRGRTTTGAVAPKDFLPASVHAPGLVYRVEDCEPVLGELLERVDADEVDARVYPQVHVVMRLLLAGRACEWLALPTVEEGAYRPSGITDGAGGAYWSLESRWKQLKAYDALLSNWAETDPTGRAREMLAAQRERAFPLIANSLRIEDPVLADAFENGARARYAQPRARRLRDLAIVKWAARQRRRLRRR